MSDSDAQPSELAREVSSSLAGVWKDYAGERPAEVETAIKGTRVACVLREAVTGFEGRMAAIEADPPGEATVVLTPTTYRRDAIAAVSRATGRRVMAFVSKHDKGTDTATELFILDRPPKARPPISVSAESAQLDGADSRAARRSEA